MKLQKLLIFFSRLFLELDTLCVCMEMFPLLGLKLRFFGVDGGFPLSPGYS